MAKKRRVGRYSKEFRRMAVERLKARDNIIMELSQELVCLGGSSTSGEINFIPSTRGTSFITRSILAAYPFNFDRSYSRRSPSCGFCFSVICFMVPSLASNIYANLKLIGTPLFPHLAISASNSSWANALVSLSPRTI